MSKAFDTSFGKCKLIQGKIYLNNHSKQFQTKIWRNYNFFKFLPELYTVREVFPATLFLPFCRFSILVFLSFSYIFSIPSWKWRPTLFSARAQASIYMVFWPFSRKKKCQIVKEVWTMTEQVVKSKDLKKQTKHEWMAVFHKMCTCEKYYRKSCKYMRNNSTKQKGKKISTSHYRSKFPARQNGDKLPKKVGKPWRGKGGAHFTQASCQKDLPTLYQRRTSRQTHLMWTS